MEEDKSYEELRQEVHPQFLCYQEKSNHRFQELEGMLDLIAGKMDRLVKLRARKQARAKFENPFANTSTNSIKKDSVQHLKLRFPKYDEKSGANVWLQDCEQYFEIFKVGKNKRVAIAGMHLEGSARNWFQVYTTGRNDGQWEDFCGQFNARFGAWDQELLHDNFKNLKQVTTEGGILFSI